MKVKLEILNFSKFISNISLCYQIFRNLDRIASNFQQISSKVLENF